MWKSSQMLTWTLFTICNKKLELATYQLGEETGTLITKGHSSSGRRYKSKLRRDRGEITDLRRGWLDSDWLGGSSGWRRFGLHLLLNCVVVGDPSIHLRLGLQIQKEREKNIGLFQSIVTHVYLIHWNSKHTHVGSEIPWVKKTAISNILWNYKISTLYI